MTSESGAAPPIPRSRYAALAIGVGILVSRLFGLVRVAVMARYFGTSLYADAFTVGLRVPNVLQNLLGEGTLSASFIPVYSELLAHGRRADAGRTAGAVLLLVAGVAVAFAAAGVLFAPAIVTLLAPGYHGEAFAMTVTVVRWLFPMTGVLVLSAWALGILNSHRRFFLSYVAPVVWNAAIIAGTVVAGSVLGWSGGALLVATAASALAGAGLQFLVQLPPVLRVERGLRFDAVRTPEVAEVVRNAGPAILGRGVVQLSSFFDLFLASLLAEGAASTILYAQTFYLLPISLFGMANAAAELPELSRERNAADGVLRARTVAALNRVAFLVVPSAVALVLLGDVAVGLLKQGAFGLDQVHLVHYTLAAYCLGLPAATSSRVVSSAFFALRDTRTPARVAAMRVALSAVVALAVMAQLEPIELLGVPAGPLAGWRAGALPLGPVGLAAGTAAAAWFEWWFLSRALAQRIGGLSGRHVLLARLWVAALCAGALGFAVRALLGDGPPIAVAMVVYGVFGAAYLAVGGALGVSEVRSLTDRVRARLVR